MWDGTFISFKILKESVLQKQTVTHIKAPILCFLEPEEQGSGIIMGIKKNYFAGVIYGQKSLMC